MQHRCVQPQRCASVVCCSSRVAGRGADHMVEHQGTAAGAAESKRNGVAEPKVIAVERVREEGSATGGVDGPDQGKQTTIFKVLVVGIGVVLLAFGVAVYGFKAHIDL